MLQNKIRCGKINVDNGWVTCPECGRNHRLLYVHPETEARHLQIYCKTCRNEIILDISKGQSVKRQGQ